MSGGGRYGRQTFIDVAEAIKIAKNNVAHIPNNPTAFDINAGMNAGIDMVAEAIADRFAERQRSFDRDLFLRNCGLQ